MLDEGAYDSLRDRVFLLRSLPSFAALDDESVSLVAEHARSRRFSAGTVLLTEGEPVHSVYLVLEGTAVVSKRGRIVQRVERPFGAGFAAFLSRDPEGCQCVAEKDTVALEIPAQAMHEAMEASFPLLRNSLRISAQTLVKRRGDLPVNPERAGPAKLGDPVTRSPTLVERMIALSSSPLFAGANLDSIIEIARCAREVRFAPGDRIWEIGERADFQLRILYGRVRCTAADGRSVDVGADFALGGLDAMGEGRRSFAAVADTDVFAYRMETADFLGVLEMHFELARNLLATVARSNLAGT